MEMPLAVFLTKSLCTARGPTTPTGSRRSVMMVAVRGLSSLAPAMNVRDIEVAGMATGGKREMVNPEKRLATGGAPIRGARDLDGNITSGAADMTDITATDLCAAETRRL